VSGRERDLWPRRLTEAATPDDPFMKLVPRDAPDKAGGLRVLLVADFNVAGQMTRIMRALNRYTNHMARCVILQDDYLNYDRDLVICEQDGTVSHASREEAAQLVRKADFFHIGRQLFTLPDIDWNHYVSPGNAIYQYFGSHLRDNAGEIHEFHRSSGFAAITAAEWTMYRALPRGYYHIQPYMIETGDLPQQSRDFSGPLRICHAPSSSNYKSLKRTDLILETMQRLANRRSDVESVTIEGVANEECLQIKSGCHLHLVALRYGFGLNAIESAAMGVVPLAQLPNFVRMIYPDSPVVHITAETIMARTEALLDDRARLADLSAACRDWAVAEFDAERLIRKYWYLYDLVYNGLSVDYPVLVESSKFSLPRMHQSAGRRG
jgi:hypothetical protein